MEFFIRTAKEEDAEELLKIYSYYVLNTAITFECEVPSITEFKRRIRETLLDYPYFVAVVDGNIAGYIYAGRFKTRAAYNWSASTSIYINSRYHRMGIGKRLYEELEKTLIKQNVVNLYAGAASPMESEDEYLTRRSELFHKAIGYETAAVFHGAGNKFGRWYNMMELEKIIGERCCPPKEFIPFSNLKSQVEKRD